LLLRDMSGEHPQVKNRCIGHVALWRFTHLSDDGAVAKMGHPLCGLVMGVECGRFGLGRI
jgi:hypothetical protein